MVIFFKLISPPVGVCFRLVARVFRSEGPRFAYPKKADKNLKVRSEPIHEQGNDISIGVSVGISLYPKDTKDAETLIKLADAAMCKVKKSGRNRYNFYNPAWADPLT